MIMVTALPVALLPYHAGKRTQKSVTFLRTSISQCSAAVSLRNSGNSTANKRAWTQEDASRTSRAVPSRDGDWSSLFRYVGYSTFTRRTRGRSLGTFLTAMFFPKSRSVG